MAFDFDSIDPADAKLVRAKFAIAQSLRFDEPGRPKRKQQGRGENQLERDFDFFCECQQKLGWIYKYWLKPFVLRIGPGMTFEPDHMVLDGECGNTWVIDCKGPHSWEDSRIKIKIAAEKFPMWKWLIVTRPNGTWRAKEVTAAKGIGRKFIELPWLA